MVKFSKQLELQLVPEWRHKFCDYWQLKKEIKKIKVHRLQAAGDLVSPRLEAPVSGWIDGTLTPLTNLARRKMYPWYRENMIKVHQRKSQHEEMYETELLEPLAQEEHEKAFFTTLDAELNKVNQFFCMKEQEFVERAELLSRQLDNLTEIRKSYDLRRGNSSSSRSLLASIFGSSSSLAEAGTTGEDSEENSMHPLNQLKVVPVADLSSSDSDDNATSHKHLASAVHVMITNMADTMLQDPQVANPRPYDEEQPPETNTNQHQSNLSDSSSSASQLRSNMKLGFPKPLPFLSLSSFTQRLWDDKPSSPSSVLRSSRELEQCVPQGKIKPAQKRLRAAFVEFYRGLGLLRNFSSLNMLAFAKILKKYDKVTGRQASPTYLKVVEKAHFSTSDKVIKMMDEVERLFTEHFAKDDEKKAMIMLRPAQKKATHTITFFLGLFSGCSLALFMAFIILALHLQKLQSQSSKGIPETYLPLTYQVFSMLFLILLHMYIYGWNVYAWRKARINYAFIFEFAPKTELRNREVLLVCTGLTTMVSATMLGHLVACSTQTSHFNPDIVPLIIIIALLLLLVCPLNICYRSSRVHFLGCMKRVVLSPLYKVILADFFLADQLTSQVAALRSLQFVMCYYFGGYFQTHNNGACGSTNFRFLAYLISFLPYWWRLMQCVRRWVDESDRSHLTNGGKYLSAMVAAAARITYSYQLTTGWLGVFVITSSFATVYQMYWDIVRDWGFFQPKSKNPWLRDQLLLQNKSIYYFSIALNFVLRFAWLQQVTHWQIRNIEHSGTDLFFASLEVIRRGHWNFYRLENEHLNNVGKFRAVKLVPLPFRDAYDNYT